MEEMRKKLEAFDWAATGEDLHTKGYSVINSLLSPAQCKQLIDDYQKDELYRKTITMERYRFGQGEYKYFNYPLPSLIQQLREYIYTKLAPVANGWMKALDLPVVYPTSLTILHEQCAQHNQVKPTVLILKYGPGGHNTLHQDLYGALFFPLQMVLFLNDPEKDYSGGEFVLTQQTPRAQSKAIVLTPGLGDALIFTTNFRPVKGSRGYYRANMKHGVSELHSGQRHTLGIIFHDALT